MTSSDGSGLTPAPAPDSGAASTTTDTSQGENGTAQEAEKSAESANAGSTVVGDTDYKPGAEVTPPLNQAYNQDVKDRYEEGLAVADALPEDPHEVETEYVIAAHLDPARQRDPNGVYLDDIVRQQAETVRARIEGREPDYKNPGTTASDVLQTKHTASKFVDANADVPVHTTLPVVVGTPKE